MLESIRQNVRHPYIQALLGMVILVFILFFGWSASTQKPKYLAKVNGDTVDQREYQRVYEGLTKIYQDALGPAASPEQLRQMGLGRRALDQLIDELLLMQEADRQSLKVTKAEVEAAIAAIPAFQSPGGGFELKRYELVLQQNRLTPAEFEGMKERELLLDKVQQSIRAQAKVTDDEVRKEYDARNTKITVEYVSYDPASLQATVPVTEKELRAAYEARKESFRTPEKRVARYALFTPEAHASDVKVTDEEVAKEFASGGAQATEKESVRARHILVKLAAGAKPDEEAKVRAKAESVLKEAKAGKDFATLAKKYSEDPGSKEKGGDLGAFERGQMVPAFEEAAFALKPGQLSDLVKTQFGFHVIKVEEHRGGGVRTLEQARPALEAAVRKRKALEAAYRAADQALIALEDKKETWEALAKKVPVSTSAPVARGGAVEGVAKPRELVNLLFTLDPTKPGNLLESDKGTYLIAVEKVVPSAIAPFEEVKEQVEAGYRQAESKKLAEKKAADFLESAKKGGWDAAAKAAGVKPEATEPVTLRGAPPAKLAWTPELRDAAFALTAPGALGPKPFEVQGKIYAFRVATRTPADPAGLGAQKEKLATELLPAKQNEALQEKLKNLKAVAKIKINEELLM
ncbi:MAG: hypothetical protein HGA98_00990 [Deltaproteobacteria bacterium]|nr:hypothetical protein [Deltaproteobacteria bacterium]